jgi:hypothetical protein
MGHPGTDADRAGGAAITVEVVADQALAAGRWRHTTRFVRTRLDM